MLRRKLHTLLFLLLGLGIGLLLAETVLNFKRYRSQRGSICALADWWHERGSLRELPETTDPALGADALGAYLQSEAEVERLIPAFRAQHVLLHNTPLTASTMTTGPNPFVDPEYTKLQSVATDSQIVDAGGYLANAPGVAYDFTYLRSRVFNSHDPVVIEARADDPLQDDVYAFREKYGLARSRVTIGTDGDRVTLPASSSRRIILVVGDSMAFGYGVADGETIPSRLQEKYPAFRFVNVGVTGCTPRDNFQRLRERLAHYGQQVEGVVYVHCENDYDRVRGDDPASIVARLTELLDKHRVTYRALVYQTYIYRALPDLFRDNSPEVLHRYYALKADLLARARAQGITTLDWCDLVDDYRRQHGTPFAGMALYADRCHFSAIGNALVADALLPPPSQSGNVH